jgi:hypothetical protein
MTMESNQEHGGLLHSAGGQITLLVLATVGVLILAWLYIW